jgi:DNA-binding XRE family transcriptional regulator
VSDLRTLREAAELTQQQVARSLNISERTVIRHEVGTTPLRRWHRMAYGELYGVDPDSIRQNGAAA